MKLAAVLLVGAFLTSSAQAQSAPDPFADLSPVRSEAQVDYCDAFDQVVETQNEIAYQKQLERESGVVDMRARRELTQELLRERRMLAEAKAALKAAKLQPKPCH